MLVTKGHFKTGKHRKVLKRCTVDFRSILHPSVTVTLILISLFLQAPNFGVTHLGLSDEILRRDTAPAKFSAYLGGKLGVTLIFISSNTSVTHDELPDFCLAGALVTCDAQN